jgi:hypothetical protein
MNSAQRSARPAQSIVQAVVAALLSASAPCIGPVMAQDADSARTPQTDSRSLAFQGAAAMRYREILAGLAARDKLDDDAALLGRARRISAGLIAVAAQSYRETSGWAWEIHVTSDASTGAFCMAGGKILLGSALVRDLVERLHDEGDSFLLGRRCMRARMNYDVRNPELFRPLQLHHQGVYALSPQIFCRRRQVDEIARV